VTVLVYPLLTQPVPERAFLLKGSQTSSVCPSGKDNMQTKMSMEHWWNNSDWGKPKYSEKNLS